MIFKNLALTLTIVPGFLFAQSIKAEEVVGFGCSISGKPTKPVIRVTELLEQKKYTAVAELLKSNNNAERYLAVIVMERLTHLSLYKLSSNEVQLISALRDSEGKVSVCSGCRYFGKMSLQQLFNSPKLLHKNYWLDEVLPKKR